MNDEIQVVKQNLGYDVAHLGFQANRETLSVVDEKTPQEIYDKPATGISLVPAGVLKLMEGAEFALAAEPTPATANIPAITWETSDRTIAEVTDEGIVFAHKAGTTTIKATSDNSLAANISVRVLNGKEPKYTLTVEVVAASVGMGTVTGSGEYLDGDEVAISAIPAENHRFVKWSDNNTSAERTITMPASAKTLKATFEIIPQQDDEQH